MDGLLACWDIVIALVEVARAVPGRFGDQVEADDELVHVRLGWRELLLQLAQRITPLQAHLLTP